jgi:hypothetical protein
VVVCVCVRVTKPRDETMNSWIVACMVGWTAEQET